MWDIVEERDSAEIQSHLKTLGAFNLDYTRSNDETVIRIPLRTQAQAKTSKIFQQEVSIQNIQDALADFGQEIQEGGLLFLKHIRKITTLSPQIVAGCHLLDSRQATRIWQQSGTLSCSVNAFQPLGQAFSPTVALSHHAKTCLLYGPERNSLTPNPGTS